MKKQIKRITAFAAAVAMAATFTFPAEIGDSFFGFGNVIVASAETFGDCQYNDNGDNTVTITRYFGRDGSVEIPELIGGKAVTSIGDYAFESCTGLESITIPNSVTSIGDYAFESCTGLESITIPYGVTSIGEAAFGNCYSLTSITIPDRVTSIGDYVFCDCSGLTSITIPDSVTSIGERAFYKCTGLESITIPSSVTSIGKGAFGACTGLESITIPDGVTSIGDSAFESCTGLTSITIPSSVSSIGDWAFVDCTGFTSITIPGGVTSIGFVAFGGCTGLTRITVDSNNPYYCSESGVLFNKNKTTLICYPAGKTDSSYTIPDEVTSIELMAFYACTGLTSITIPDEVTSIELMAFYACTGLTSITIPDGVTSIGNYAFEGCTGLKSIFLPENLDITYAEIPSTTAQVKYTVSDSKVTITKMTNVTEGQKIDIPEKISGYPVVYIAEACRQYLGNHTHYFENNNSCTLCGIIKLDNASITIAEPKAAESLAATASVATANIAADPTVTWQPAHTNAGYNTEYTASVTLSPSIGYIFADNVSVSVNETPVDSSNITKNADDTITVNYTFGATDKRTLTSGDFTFTEPSDLIYNGGAKTASVTTALNGVGNITIKYYDENGVELASAPVNVGEYSVKIDVAEGDNYQISDLTADSWKFTIGKADAPTITDINESYNWAATGQKNVTVSGLPDDMGTVGAITAEITSNDNNILTADSAGFDINSGEVSYTLNSNTSDKIGSTANIKVTITSQNYKDIVFNVVVTITDKNTRTDKPDCTLTLSYDSDNNYTATITAVEGAEYSFDGTNWSDTNTKSVGHDETVTGYIRYKETDEYNASEYNSDSKTTGHGTLTHYDAVAPTCTTNGNVEYWECSECGKYFFDADGSTEIDSIVANATGHSLTYHDAVAPDCTTDGNVEYWSCGNCTKNFSDENGTNEIDDIVDPAKHSLAYHDAVAHTCTTDGNAEYWDCSVCGKNFSDADGKTEIDDIVDPAPGHNWDTAYDSNETHHWHNCTNDNCPTTENNQKDGYDVHTPGAAATETTPQTCTECGYELAPALGHIHANHLTFVAEVPASCTADGVKAHYECDCGKLFFDTDDAAYVTAEDLKIAAHHTYGTDWESDNDENHYHACSVCSDKADVTSHSYDSGMITIPATETTEGVKTYTCSVCNHTKTETVPKLSHTHSLSDDHSKDETGHWHTCSGCDEKVDFGAHIENSGTVTVQPTETSTGVMTYYCSVCGYEMRTEEIPAITPEHTHSYGTEWKSDSVSHWHECSCGEKTDIAQHISNGGVVTVQPTETSTGVMIYYCSVCGYEMRTDEIPAITPEHTHSYGTEWKSDSTLHWHECSCGEKTDTAQHISNGGTVTVQPTAYSTGLRTYSCTVCGYVIRTESIPATGMPSYPAYPTYPTYPVYTPSNSSTNTAAPKLTVKAETQGKTATLSWNEIPNVDSYIIYQLKDGKYVKVKTTTDTSVTFKNLTNGKTYKFMVKYTMNGRTYSTGASGKFTVKIYYKPIAKATAGRNSIKLTWQSVPNAEKYAVYKYVDGKAVKLAEVKGTSVKINKLTPDTEYQYIVRAYVDGEWTSMKKFDIVTIKTKAE